MKKLVHESKMGEARVKLEVKSKEIEMIHRLFLVMAMYCQASSTAVQ